MCVYISGTVKSGGGGACECSTPPNNYIYMCVCVCVYTHTHSVQLILQFRSVLLLLNSRLNNGSLYIIKNIIFITREYLTLKYHLLITSGFNFYF